MSSTLTRLFQHLLSIVLRPFCDFPVSCVKRGATDLGRRASRSFCCWAKKCAGTDNGTTLMQKSVASHALGYDVVELPEVVVITTQLLSSYYFNRIQKPVC
jgi:hypothetical protein